MHTEAVYAFKYHNLKRLFTNSANLICIFNIIFDAKSVMKRCFKLKK